MWCRPKGTQVQLSCYMTLFPLQMASKDERLITNDDKKDWLALFRKYDDNSDGLIPMSDLKSRVEEAGNAVGLSQEQKNQLLTNADRNGDRQINFEEFCLLMSRAKSLRLKTLMFRAAELVSPKSHREKIFSELQQYNCCPPPIFMITITIVEVAIYIYYMVDMNQGVTIGGPTPLNSPLIYNPYRRYEAWRFVSYMFIHIGIVHIFFNALTQLVLGIPLELVNKFWRVGLVYVLGVISGSLAVSVCDPMFYLAGASGGVYALLAAHVANLVVNFGEMEFAVIRLIGIVLIIGADLGVALYNRYGVKSSSEANSVSFVAHVGGFVCGLLMGIVVLRNFKQHSWERVVWWISLVGYIVLVIVCVLWNIFYNQYPASQY